MKDLLLACLLWISTSIHPGVVPSTAARVASPTDARVASAMAARVVSSMAAPLSHTAVSPPVLALSAVAWIPTAVVSNRNAVVSFSCAVVTTSTCAHRRSGRAISVDFGRFASMR